MRVLFLVEDAARSHRLVQAWQALAPQAACRVCSDDLEALFVSAPAGVDWLVLDPAAVQAHRAAWLASWHRLAPDSRVLELDADPLDDEPRLQWALAAAGPH